MKINRKKIRQIYFKLVKQPGSPDSIARGVAVGLFVGFIAPIGIQMVIAFPVALALRARKIPALACTWITNYFTIPFIYPIQCYIGSLVMGAPLSLSHINQQFKDFFVNPSAKGLLALGSDICWSFLIGGAIFGAIAAFIGYFTSYGMIVRYRQQLDMRRRRKFSAAGHHDAQSN